MKSLTKRNLCIIIAFLMAVTGLIVATPQQSNAEMKKAKIFFLLPNSTTIRFERRDGPLTKAAIKKLMPNAEVTIQNGEGDPARQQRLVEDAIAQGADVILYVSSDANLAAGSLNAAAQANVPVILYEHDAIGGPANAHVLFNALAVGQAQGKRAVELIKGMSKSKIKIARVKGNQGEYGTKMYEVGQNQYLKPFIDSGKVEVVCESFTVNWNPVKAQSFAEDCLTKQGGDVDMFIGMNDGTTGGSVAALISQGYKPGEKIVTGGQDATVEALQFIIQGYQDNTIFKDLRVMAQAAADCTHTILNGGSKCFKWINGKVNNDMMDVPAAFLPVNNVTLKNIGDVVEAGIYTWKEICQGGEKTEICRKNL
jgi:D-xylose transport system substrate-binding protein